MGVSDKKMGNLLQNYNKNIAAIEDTGNSITYDELFKEGEEVCNHINKRCLTFCLCTNTIGSLIGYVGFLNSKIVPVLLAAKLDEELYRHLIDSYHPEYIWAPIGKNENETRFEKVYEKFGYALYKTNYKGYPLYEELGLLLTTSGSTGSPKLVRQSYKNVKANTESIVEYLQLNSSERPITTLPMNYTYGLSVINTHLYVGATILMTNKGIMEKEFWDFLKENKATSIAGVPYTYEMLNKLRFLRMDLPHLKTMTQAGGKLLPELHKQFAEFAVQNNKKFIVMYGQTEATARMAYLPAEKSLEKYGSMGIPIPGGRFELWNLENQVISDPDIAGELVYYGDNVTLGYAENGSDLCKGDERNGVLHTGDVAKRDSEGYYFIVGRLKRFLKIFGNRVNLDETERLIKAEFNISDCACAGVDDKMRIYLTNADEEIGEDVKKFISSKTGLNSSAFEIVIIAEIPKNDAGKILYNELD